MTKSKLFYAMYTLAFCISVLVHISCASAPPDRVALRSIQVTAKTVETSMKVAGELYRNNNITEAQKEDILKAYATYQKAAALATLGLDGVKNLSDATRLTADVQKFAEILTELIQSFGGKPQASLDFSFNPLTYVYAQEDLWNPSLTL